MFAKQLTFAAIAAVLACGAISAHAQESGALLDLLVRKKIITDQEAEEIRGELTKEFSAAPAGKLKLSQPLTELEIYGDARVRYEHRMGRTKGTGPVAAPGVGVAAINDWQERGRPRYRLRLGLRGTLVDDWFFGLRLETSASPRSTNVTFGGDSGSGPFAKNDDGVFIGQAYIGYRGIRDTTLTFGRMPMPLTTTLMVWDGDINPEGLAQQWKRSFDFNLGGGAAGPDGLSKDGQPIPGPTSDPLKMKLDLFATFGQFVYDDANPENPLGQRGVTTGRFTPNADAWLLAWQLGARITFPAKNIHFQVAPVLYTYTGLGDTFNSFYAGGSPFVTNATSLGQNQTGANDLMVLEVPSEFGFRIKEIPVRIFSDFAVNLDAEDRAFRAGRPDKDDQRYAYQIGAAIGQLKAKKDWQLQAFWQHTEQFSLDPNLVDSDIFDSRVNMEGFVIQAGYAISDAITFNLTYGNGQAADESLGTGGVGDIGINTLDRYQIFQADLNVKF